jgi:tRNA A37 methylthiotransferase MiaB
MIGKTVEVMVQGESKLVSRQSAYPASKVELGWESRVANEPRKTQMIGRTRGDLVVCFDGEASLKGEIIDIEITDARNLTLFGRAMAAEKALRV